MAQAYSYWVAAPLNGLLSEVGISVSFQTIRQRFESVWAACLATSKSDPDGPTGELMHLLEEFFGVEQIESATSGDASAYLFEMSGLGFSGLGWNVVVISHPPQSEKEELWQSRFLADQKAAADSTGICFHIILDEERPKRGPYIPSSLEAVFLSGNDLRKFFSADRPKMALAAAIREQTPVSRLCPFSTDREAIGPMFYGRRRELSMLVEELGTSFVVEGARRIGKTSLLKHAHRMLRSRSPKDGYVQSHYFNCLQWVNYRTACHLLAHKIDRKKEQRLDLGGQNIQYLLERSSRYGRRPLYLFLDEVDRLIELDAAQNWQLFSLLAWAKDEGFVRLVLAGYRSVGTLLRDKTRTVDSLTGVPVRSAPPSPLYGKLTQIQLGPLSPSETYALTCDPLIGSEVQIDGQTAVQEAVWEATAGYPFFVQFFGNRLFRRASARDPQMVTMEDVAEVTESSELCSFLVDHFLENTLINTMPSIVERAATLLFAHSSSRTWKEHDFLRACKVAEVPLGFDAFREIHTALENLCAAQILSYEHGQYRFAVPVMRQVLLNTYSDADDVLFHLSDPTY